MRKAEERVQSKMRDNEAIDEEEKEIEKQESEIEQQDAEIRKRFRETEEKIKDLPDEIKRRHRDFVEKYEENLKALRTNLKDIKKARTRPEKQEAHRKAKDFLEKVKPPTRHTPLDPNKLPHRTAEPTKRKPRLKKEEFKSDSDQQLAFNGQQSAFREPILIASNGSLDGLLSSDSELVSSNLRADALAGLPTGGLLLAAADPPTDADLGETIEVQFTEAIQAKAAELGHDPLKIYEWVRNNIEFVPTYGSIQGADYCMQTKLCNAFDTSSLLIALLRASNIHARYAYGTVEIPIEKIKNWTGGFQNAKDAIDLLASAGIPTSGMLVGNEIKYARIEHIWVEAYIDYIPSRGARHKTGQGDTWIPLDPSFKQYAYTQGIDIQSEVPFDAQSFIDEIQATATINEEEGYATGVDSAYIQQTMQDYQAQVEEYINQNHPDATVGDVLGTKEIVKEEFPYLLGTLPYRLINKGNTYATIPSNMRIRMGFRVVKDIYDAELGTPINISKSLPELAGKKITLSYSPATPADEAVINSFIPQPHPDGTPIQPEELPTSLPAYMVNVKPELRIDGTVVATGTPLTLGTNETFTMTFSGPSVNDRDVITNEVKAGNYLGIAIDPARVSQGQMETLKAKLETTKAKLEAEDFTGMTKDDILGDLLYTTALSYLAEYSAMNTISAINMGVMAITYPSETIFSYELKSNYAFGFPFSVNPNGLAMDADRLMQLAKALDGDTEKPKQFMLASGMNGSILEHSVPEQLFSTPSNPEGAISAVKALQIANSQGIPVYTVDKSSLDNVLPQLQLDAGTKADIRNAVNAGKIAKVSKTDITYSGWTGCGYIIIDPVTGAGAYMISGGMNGAFWYSLWWVGYVFLLTCQYAGIIALGALLAILLGPILFAIEGIIVSAFTASAAFIARCIQKAISAGTVGYAIQAIMKIPKRFADGLARGGLPVALTYVTLQLAKIWALTCGQPG